MDLSQIKMVVSDMDGTLLNSNHEVSDRFFELFEKLKARNIQFVAASGRQYHSMLSKLDHIKNDIIFIAENGALIKQKEDELSTTPLDQNLRAEILDSIQQIENVDAMLCGKYVTYFDRNSEQLLNLVKEYYSNYEVVDNFYDVTDEIVKVAAFHPKSAEEYIHPRLEHLEDRLKVKVSGKYWVDLNHIDAHKGNALKMVLDKFGLRPNEVVAFGDYNNDLEMLELVDYSFAMANAHPNVKEVAKYETASHNDFGVERILEKILA
ncbi:HAD family hydrolase [Croceivirga thetidis]|uniref:HAD family phosphatase n=1 Tax=Croceivirga thetidis TaxID=2721623 RepID=A0ABX1GX00_9FLAO|nr:HAD family hydrolase [Croceivirga thetidis]NKI33521.1 HAD family phosphatase [Croceivirga thetidis]